MDFKRLSYAKRSVAKTATRRKRLSKRLRKASCAQAITRRQPVGGKGAEAKVQGAERSARGARRSRQAEETRRAWRELADLRAGGRRGRAPARTPAPGSERPYRSGGARGGFRRMTEEETRERFFGDVTLRTFSTPLRRVDGPVRIAGAVPAAPARERRARGATSSREIEPRPRRLRITARRGARQLRTGEAIGRSTFGSLAARRLTRPYRRAKGSMGPGAPSG